MEFYVYVLVIGILSYLLIERADRQRSDAEKMITKLSDMLREVLESGRRASLAEEAARKSLKKLAKNRKKQIKILHRNLEEMEMLTQGDSSSEDEDEENDEDEEASPEEEKVKVNDRVVSVSLALQRKLRTARSVVEKAVKEGRTIDPKTLASILDTSLDALEKDIENG